MMKDNEKKNIENADENVGTEADITEEPKTAGDAEDIENIENKEDAEDTKSAQDGDEPDDTSEKVKKGGRMRRIRMGGYGVLLVIFAVAAAIILNLIVDAIPKKYTQFELTGEGLLDVSDTSKTLLSELDDDITGSVVTTEGGRDAQIAAFLERYAAYSDRISVETVDPNSNPDFVNRYNVSTMNSIVVRSWRSDPETGGRAEFRSRTIDYYDIYEFSQDVQNEYYSNYNYMIYGYSIDDVYQRDVFDADNELSSAIDYVTTDDLPVAYELTGHGEIDLPELFTSFIDSNNIAFDSLELLASGIPENAGLIMINNPSLDLSEKELSQLTEYIDGGGKVMLITDVTSYGAEKTPNLAALAKHCGMISEDGVILEPEGGDRYSGSRFNLVLKLNSLDITNLVSTNPTAVSIYMPRAHAITADSDYSGPMRFESIADTSENAYIIGASEEERERADGDPTGKYSVAAISRDSATGSAFVWFSSSYINTEEAYLTTNGRNSNVFAATIMTVCEKPTIVSIAGTQTNSNARLTLTDAAANTLTAVIQYAIPLSVLIVGIAVWLVRKLR